MSLVPDSKTGKVAFYQAKTEPWSQNAVQIGLTTTMTTELAAKVDNAATKIQAQNTAYDDYHTAVMTANDAVRALDLFGSECLKSIRAKAAVVGGISVYELARIPAPAIPTPVGPPGTPTNFKATLNPDGSLKLTWKCANPAGAVGTTYQIARQVDGGAVVAIGVTGPRTFIDSTLPQGAGQVVYQIQAVRSTAKGQAAEFLVRLGLGSSGQVMATVAPRMAA